VVVVHDKYGRGEDDITLQVNAVFTGYLAVSTYAAVVINDDHGFTRLLWRSRDINPRILSDDHRTAELDSVRCCPFQNSGVMDRQVVAFERKRIG
jgi:hypothetical protein